MSDARFWSVDDVVRLPAVSGGYRVWIVVGVHLGGENQESVIELKTLDRLANTQGRLLVPEAVLNCCRNGGKFVQDEPATKLASLDLSCATPASKCPAVPAAMCCPRCGDADNIHMFTADLDRCNKCLTVFPPMK